MSFLVIQQIINVRHSLYHCSKDYKIRRLSKAREFAEGRKFSSSEGVALKFFPIFFKHKLSFFRLHDAFVDLNKTLLDHTTSHGQNHVNILKGFLVSSFVWSSSNQEVNSFQETSPRAPSYFMIISASLSVYQASYIMYIICTLHKTICCIPYSSNNSLFGLYLLTFVPAHNLL